MLERLRQAAWIALFVCFLAAYGHVASTASSARAQPPEQRREGTSEHQEKGSKPQDNSPLLVGSMWTASGAFIHTYKDEITAVSTAVIALFTIILGIGTVFLWLATQRLVKSSDDAAKRQLRAYIAIDSAELESNISPDGMVKVTVGIRNFGHTPAYECRGSVNCAILDFEGDKAINFLDDLDPEIIGVIQPGSVLLKSRIRPSIGAEEISGLNAGKKAIWLFGQITYATAFDMPVRFTKFRYFLAAQIYGQLGRDFGRSQYGNDAN